MFDRSGGPRLFTIDDKKEKQGKELVIQERNL